MFDSKPLKDQEEKEHSKLYLWWIESPLSDRYYKLQYAIMKPFREIKKLWQWYRNVFRYDYDFDGHCLYRIIRYKLERIKPELINGNALHEDRDLQALDIAIKLAKRLQEDHYDMRAWDRHEKKWGKFHWEFEKIEGTESKPGGPYSRMESYWENVKTEEDKLKCNQERSDAMTLAYNIMKREERWLFAILQNHLRRWWD